MIVAYRRPDLRAGRNLMAKLFDSLNHGVPAALSELEVAGAAKRGSRAERDDHGGRTVGVRRDQLDSAVAS